MKRFFILTIAAAVFSSCVDQEQKKPVGPVSGSSNIPWNAPVQGQGAGQLGMLPQNQYRR